MIGRTGSQIRRDNESFKRLESKKDYSLKMVEVSRQITEFVETPLWKDYLLPYLESHMIAFQSDAWSLSAENFAAAQAAALRSKLIRDHILTNIGKSEHYQKEAEDAGQAIQDAIDSGRAPQGDPK